MKVSIESKGNFKNVLDWLTKVQENTPSSTLNQIAKAGEQALADATHKDTGETAAGWTSEITTKDNVSEIAWKNRAHPDAGVNVAKIIELGHGTRTGGYVPPRPYIKQAMEPIWKSTDKIVEEMIK